MELAGVGEGFRWLSSTGAASASDVPPSLHLVRGWLRQPGGLPVEHLDKFATLTLAEASDGLAGAYFTALQESLDLDAPKAWTGQEQLLDPG